MIRPAGPADADAIAAVHARAWEESYPGFVPAAVIAAAAAGRPALWRRQHDWAGIFVAEDAGGIGGFGMAGPQRDAFLGMSGEVWSLYVLRRAQGRGLGHALMRAMAAWLAAEGRPAFSLWVLDGNAPARGFYARLGGAPVAQRRMLRPGGWMLAETAYAWGTGAPL